jgi:hypothetical protein
MLLALGAVSSALDALQSLTASKSSTASTGFGQSAAAAFDLTAGSSTQPFPSGGFSQISPQTMSALIAAQSQSGATASASTDPSSALKDLFAQIDANGDGQISKPEFENALGAGGTNLAAADDVFNKLDTNGDGTVSLDEMSKALKGAGHGGHHHHHVGGASDAGSTDGSGSSTDPLSQALAGSSSNSVTNSDGSTTTSITYADGSKVTLTTPAAASSAATSSYNLVERLIQREAQALSTQAAASLSIAA